MFDNGSYLRRRRRFKKKDAIKDKDDRDRHLTGMDDSLCKNEAKDFHSVSVHDHSMHHSGALTDCNGSLGSGSSSSDDSRRDSLVMNGPSPSTCLTPTSAAMSATTVGPVNSAPMNNDCIVSREQKPVLTSLTTPKLEPLDSQHCVGDNSRPSHLAMSVDQLHQSHHNTDGHGFTVDNIITSIHSTTPMNEYGSHMSGGNTPLHPVRDSTPHNISSSSTYGHSHCSDPYRVTTSSADSSPSSTLNYYCNGQQSLFSDSRSHAGHQSMNSTSGSVLNDNELISAAAAAAQASSQHHYASMQRANWYSSSMSASASGLGDLPSTHGHGPGTELGVYTTGYDTAGVTSQSCQLAFRSPYKNNSSYHPYTDCSKY